MIPFFKTTLTGNEQPHLDLLLSGEDRFAKKEFIGKCEQWFTDTHELQNFFLTKSCTHSLELAALVLNIQPGDEVIVPSYAFVSCANAFALRGATCVFVDVRPDTMNIDETQLEKAITPKTKAIVTLNYAGVACNYEVIRAVANAHHLVVVEDNAHGVGTRYHNRHLGSFGDIATFSFDHLKNVTCIQGGGIAINNERLLAQFHIAYEFGTNRRAYFEGRGDRYEWKGLGSNFPLSELSAAMLWAQLETVDTINGSFVSGWNYYAEQLAGLASTGTIAIPQVPDECQHNGHCFYIKTRTATERKTLIDFLAERGIQAQFHYAPLHSSEFGKKHGRFSAELSITGRDADRLVRLPLYYQITDSELQQVCDALLDFYR